jgi:hypothetical protein
MPERRTRSAGPVQIKAPIAGKAQSNRSSQSIRFANGLGPMREASVLGLTRIGKAYRILLSPLVGTPHRSISAGEAANRRSDLDGPALRHFNQQMLIHELIRGSLGNIGKRKGMAPQIDLILAIFKGFEAGIIAVR